MMSTDRDNIERQVRATTKHGQAVRERALRELIELDRVVRRTPPLPPKEEADGQGEEGEPWWRKLWS
jgi:hypothetical protein